MSSETSPADDHGTTYYRVLTARTLEELWPDEDRRDAALESMLIRIYGGPQWRNASHYEPRREHPA
jgi:hypothetical protein